MDAKKGDCICQHLLKDERAAVFLQFTGTGAAYNFICGYCAKNLDELPQPLREVSEEDFERHIYYCEEVIGQPEILLVLPDLVVILDLPRRSNQQVF